MAGKERVDSPCSQRYISKRTNLLRILSAMTIMTQGSSAIAIIPSETAEISQVTE